MAAGNPNITLGEGSGCGGAVGHHQSDLGARARVLLKEINPNYVLREITNDFSDEEELKEEVFCIMLKVFVRVGDLRERLMKLQEEHDVLKNSYQVLLRANEADKQKDKGLGDGVGLFRARVPK